MQTQITPFVRPQRVYWLMEPKTHTSLGQNRDVVVTAIYYAKPCLATYDAVWNDNDGFLYLQFPWGTKRLEPYPKHWDIPCEGGHKMTPDEVKALFS